MMYVCVFGCNRERKRESEIVSGSARKRCMSVRGSVSVCVCACACARRDNNINAIYSSMYDA